MQRLLTRLAVALTLSFILAPILIVIATAFGEASYVQFPPTGLTLKWFAAAARRPEFQSAGWTSLWLAASSTAIATPFALAAAIGLVRGRFRGRDAIQTFLTSPMIVPGIVISLALLVTSAALGVRSDLRLLGAHVLLTLPYLTRSLIASLLRSDTLIEDAAYTLGASRLQTFLIVTLPGLYEGLLAGMLFALIISFDNVSISLFLASAKSNTLPLAVLSYVEFNYDPSIAALSTVLIVVSIASALVLERAVGLRAALGK